MAPIEKELLELVTLERPPSIELELEPHPYTPHVKHPAWCSLCPFARGHRIHVNAAAGEQP